LIVILTYFGVKMRKFKASSGAVYRVKKRTSGDFRVYIDESSFCGYDVLLGLWPSTLRGLWDPDPLPSRNFVHRGIDTYSKKKKQIRTDYILFWIPRKNILVMAPITAIHNNQSSRYSRDIFYNLTRFSALSAKIIHTCTCTRVDTAAASPRATAL